MAVAQLSAKPHFSYRIVCRSGVLTTGTCDDFLVCVSMARAKKAHWILQFPNSCLRVQIFYPNQKRADSRDVAAALRALDSIAPQTDRGCPVRESIGQMVHRRAATAPISPARSAARTAVIGAACCSGLALDVDVDFSQAGVVAPPDSPDFGKSLFVPLCSGEG